jgi:hypothetical protein
MEALGGRGGIAPTHSLSSFPPLLNVVSHTTTHFLFSLSSSVSKGWYSVLRKSLVIKEREVELLSCKAQNSCTNRTNPNAYVNNIWELAQRMARQSWQNETLLWCGVILYPSTPVSCSKSVGFIFFPSVTFCTLYTQLRIYMEVLWQNGDGLAQAV